MSASPEFTPKEQFQASLYKDPKKLFIRALLRSLAYLIPSITLMVIWFFTRDPACALFAYGILLYQAVYRLVLTKRGLETTGSIIRKYESKREEK
jgi:hypothetical protein